MFHAAATHADTVYVFGGRDKAKLKSDRSCVAEVEQYNWHANKWTVLQARLALPRFELAAACVNGRIYVLGGRIDKEVTALDVVECLDTQTGQMYAAAPLPIPNRAMAALSVTVVSVRKKKLNQADYATRDVISPFTDNAVSFESLICRSFIIANTYTFNYATLN